MQVLVNYIGLARQLAGVDEEIVAFSDDEEKEATLDKLIEAICRLHEGELAETLAAKAGTPLGQIIIQVNSESIRINESKDIKIQESSPVSILIIPTIVGG